MQGSFLPSLGFLLPARNPRGQKMCSFAKLQSAQQGIFSKDDTTWKWTRKAVEEEERNVLHKETKKTEIRQSKTRTGGISRKYRKVKRGKQWTRYLGIQTGCYTSLSPDGEGSVSSSPRAPRRQVHMRSARVGCRQVLRRHSKSRFFSAVFWVSGGRPGKKRGWW